MNRERLEQLLQKIAEVKLIVMGDYFLDYYLFMIARSVRFRSKRVWKPIK
jgi:bifunctional ADP-heptose synthase (sugar kinase/adenylyltransferase)